MSTYKPSERLLKKPAQARTIYSDDAVETILKETGLPFSEKCRDFVSPSLFTDLKLERIATPRQFLKFALNQCAITYVTEYNWRIMRPGMQLPKTLLQISGKAGELRKLLDFSNLESRAPISALNYAAEVFSSSPNNLTIFSRAEMNPSKSDLADYATYAAARVVTVSDVVTAIRMLEAWARHGAKCFSDIKKKKNSDYVLDGLFKNYSRIYQQIFDRPLAGSIEKPRRDTNDRKAGGPGVRFCRAALMEMKIDMSEKATQERIAKLRPASKRR